MFEVSTVVLDLTFQFLLLLADLLEFSVKIVVAQGSIAQFGVVEVQVLLLF